MNKIQFIYTYLGGDLGHELTSDDATYQPSGPQVCQSDQEVEGAIPHGDQGILTEHDRLSPAGGFGELGKHNAGKTGLETESIN